MSRRLLHVMLVVVLPGSAVSWFLLSSEADENTSRVSSEAGEAAPDFTLQLFDGTTFRLSQHLTNDGRPVVMNFWASWCVPCREEMPAFDALARQRPDILILGVAVQDTEPAAERFTEEIGVTYSLGFDREG